MYACLQEGTKRAEQASVERLYLCNTHKRRHAFIAHRAFVSCLQKFSRTRAGGMQWPSWVLQSSGSVMSNTDVMLLWSGPWGAPLMNAQSVLMLYHQPQQPQQAKAERLWVTGRSKIVKAAKTKVGRDQCPLPSPCSPWRVLCPFMFNFNSKLNQLHSCLRHTTKM